MINKCTYYGFARSPIFNHTEPTGMCAQVHVVIEKGMINSKGVYRLRTCLRVHALCHGGCVIVTTRDGKQSLTQQPVYITECLAWLAIKVLSKCLQTLFIMYILNLITIQLYVVSLQAEPTHLDNIAVSLLIQYNYTSCLVH